jgi:hypothetical protein
MKVMSAIERCRTAALGGHVARCENQKLRAHGAAFKAYLRPLREIDWVIYAKEPFAGPRQVLRYLSRYTHRIAISNRRLVSAGENGVAFKYKDIGSRGLAGIRR